MRTDADRDVHSKEDGKLLNPTKEHYAEVNALLDWLNRSFYKSDLALPMATFVTDSAHCVSYLLQWHD